MTNFFSFFLVFASSSLVLASSLSLPAIFLNQQGVEALKENKTKAAFEKFVEALGKDPFAAELQINMGLTFEMEQKADSAQQAYESAIAKTIEKANELGPRFVALFNKAQLLAKGEKIDEALKHYQMALEVVPDSKEVKTNIELLIQKKQQQQQQKEQDSKDKDQDKDQNKDQKQDKDKNKGKDKDKDKEKDQGDDQNKDNDKDNKDQDKNKDQNKKYAPNKPQPKKFESREVSENDVRKIFGELKQQEQKIRAEYNRQESKENPRDKDW